MTISKKSLKKGTKECATAHSAVASPRGNEGVVICADLSKATVKTIEELSAKYAHEVVAGVLAV